MITFLAVMEDWCLDSTAFSYVREFFASCISCPLRNPMVFFIFKIIFHSGLSIATMVFFTYSIKTSFYMISIIDCFYLMMRYDAFPERLGC